MRDQELRTWTGAVFESSCVDVTPCFRCTTPQSICCKPLVITEMMAMTNPTKFTLTSVTVLQGQQALQTCSSVCSIRGWSCSYRLLSDEFACSTADWQADTPQG